MPVDGPSASYNFGTVDNKVTIKAPNQEVANETQALLAKIDTDHDGTISRSEWKDNAGAVASLQRKVDIAEPQFKFDVVGNTQARFDSSSVATKSIESSLGRVDAQADELRLTAETRTSGPVHVSFLNATFKGEPVTTKRPQINPEGGTPKYASLESPILTPAGKEYVTQRQTDLKAQYAQVRSDINASKLPDSDKQVLLAKVDTSEAKMNQNVANTFATSQERTIALKGSTDGANAAKLLEPKPKYQDHFAH